MHAHELSAQVVFEEGLCTYPLMDLLCGCLDFVQNLLEIHSDWPCCARLSCRLRLDVILDLGSCNSGISRRD